MNVSRVRLGKVVERRGIFNFAVISILNTGCIKTGCLKNSLFTGCTCRVFKKIILFKKKPNCSPFNLSWLNSVWVVRGKSQFVFVLFIGFFLCSAYCFGNLISRYYHSQQLPSPEIIWIKIKQTAFFCEKLFELTILNSNKTWLVENIIFFFSK